MKHKTMKHKLLILLLAIITALICAVGVTACTNSHSGRVTSFYYQLNDDETYTVKGSKGTPGGEYVIEIPSKYKDLPVTGIYLKAFSGYDRATGVIIPESVTYIGWEAFYGCKNLKTIKLPDSLTSIGTKAFYGTAYYNDESNWKDSVLYIGNHLIEAKDTIEGSYNIKDGTLCIASDAFYNRTALTSVTMSNSVTAIGGSAFSDCSKLTSVTIGNGVTSIGGGAFSGCSGLTSITIPESVTSIGASAFSGCSGLTSITIPNSITSINNMTFNKCSSMTSITIPKSVTYIGNGAFGGSKLDINYLGTIEEWNNIEKDSDWGPGNYKCTIYCSDGEISK